MKITIVVFEGCMTSAVFGQADAFAVAAYISERRAPWRIGAGYHPIAELTRCG
jgi:hypothetical protein